MNRSKNRVKLNKPQFITACGGYLQYKQEVFIIIDPVTGKVIIEKSRGEVSLMGQETNENVS